jgi:hypothetical protein
VDTGFRKTSCSKNKLERDDDSKKSHHALTAGAIAPAGSKQNRHFIELFVRASELPPKLIQ